MPTTVYAQQQADRFITGKHVDLVVVECTCGILFAIPENLNRSALKWRGARGWQISCPLGHTWHYAGDNEEERLRKQLDNERAWSGRLAAERDQLQGSLSATKGVVTKQRKKLVRAANGVCPCCNRTFQNLMRHMDTKHPDYTPDQTS